MRQVDFVEVRCMLSEYEDNPLIYGAIGESS